ncbi:IgGFc-binding protein-like [Ascaphus truei]|uniref:IgGFc-binding protein-like n=1 Tax=Ascaphus truei TaxID=8439 RepID=UPI003F5A0C5F
MAYEIRVHQFYHFNIFLHVSEIIVIETTLPGGKNKKPSAVELCCSPTNIPHNQGKLWGTPAIAHNEVIMFKIIITETTLPGGKNKKPSGPGAVTPMGKEFITVFMQNHNPKETPQLELLVTGSSPSTSVSVTINKSNFKKHLKVGKGETVTIPITEPVEMHGTGKFPHSVVIKADADIAVVSRNYKYASADTSLLYPVHQLGVQYYIITPPWGPESTYKEFSVVTYDKSTTVDVYLKGAVNFQGKVYPKGSKLTLTLEPFQAVQFQSPDDLSGTKVISRHPVAVLSGHTCSKKNGECDHVYEQLLPVDSWGTTFFVPPLSFQPKSDVVFVVASQNTRIDHQSGTEKRTKNVKAGEVIQIEIKQTSPLSIHASDKIQVLFYGTGGTFKDKSFDPFLTNVPDIEQFCFTYELTGQAKFETNLAIILTKTLAAPGITFDGKAPGEIKWKVFPGSEYSWGEYSYGGGFSIHKMQHLTVAFGLLSIGYSERIGYGSVAPCINGPRALGSWINGKWIIQMGQPLQPKEKIIVIETLPGGNIKKPSGEYV